MTLSSKNVIRKEIRSTLKRQSPEGRARKSGIIAEKLFSSDDFQKARFVMFYVAMGEEVETRRMIEKALQEGKKVAVPYIENETGLMTAALINNTDKDLEKGPYGIYQPRQDALRKVPLENIDLVIVPGVAFDEKNHRIGKGKGYYDNFLGKLSPDTVTIGICFAFQIVKQVPVESHDVPVTKVISD